MNPPILVKAQVNHPFLLTTDASKTLIGGVLSQIQSDGSNKPIGYFSKKLNPCESRYSATDKEALAVVLGSSRVEIFVIFSGVGYPVYCHNRPSTNLDARTAMTTVARHLSELRQQKRTDYWGAFLNDVHSYPKISIQALSKSWLGQG